MIESILARIVAATRADLAERVIPAEVPEEPAAEGGFAEEPEPEGIGSMPDVETASAAAN